MDLLRACASDHASAIQMTILTHEQMICEEIDPAERSRLDCSWPVKHETRLNPSLCRIIILGVK